MYLPVRKSPRWKKYDYSSEGCYFVTIVTKDRELYFGEIVDRETMLSDIGKFCDEELCKAIEMRLQVEIMEYIIMPNHIHLIVAVGTGFCPSANHHKPENNYKPANNFG